MMDWILFKLWEPRPDKIPPLDPSEVAKALAYMRRRQNDALTGLRAPWKRFDAASFVTALQILPPVIGRMAIVDAQRKARRTR